MEIGILGLTFNSGNKGCEALSYSFLQMIEKIMCERKTNIKINIIIPLPMKKIVRSNFNMQRVKQSYYPKIEYNHLEFNCLFYVHKRNHFVFLNDPKVCSVVFDFTAGDSFTDIYGEDRFWDRTRCKKAIIDKGIPLVLGSQTIGPFNSTSVVDAACYVINKSLEVYVRDKLSYECVEEISNRKPKLTSDIAFALPFYEYKLLDNKKTKLGFNPSGLLWNGGYTQDNQFGLSVDYKRYCREIISLLQHDYEIHLIPHAFTDNSESRDNDYISVKELHNEFPDTILCDGLSTPMDIKSYIAQMDIFLGARMHATIAAFSAGVPVIPFSYSRKFEGLFESLNYNFVIHGKESSTDDAIKTTINYVNKVSELKKCMEVGTHMVSQSNRYIMEEIEKILFQDNN